MRSLDHVVVYGLRPDSLVPEGRTDKKLAPIRTIKTQDSDQSKRKIGTSENVGLGPIRTNRKGGNRAKSG